MILQRTSWRGKPVEAAACGVPFGALTNPLQHEASLFLSLSVCLTASFPSSALPTAWCCRHFISFPRHLILHVSWPARLKCQIILSSLEGGASERRYLQSEGVSFQGEWLWHGCHCLRAFLVAVICFQGSNAV